MSILATIQIYRKALAGRRCPICNFHFGWKSVQHFAQWHPEISGGEMTNALIVSFKESKQRILQGEKPE